MAEFTHQMTITRRGVVVANAEVIFGSFGVFIGDQDGEVEVQIPMWAWADKVIVPIYVLDPSDGVAVVIIRTTDNNGSSNAEMTVHGRYREPDGWTPPIP